MAPIVSAGTNKPVQIAPKALAAINRPKKTRKPASSQVARPLIFHKRGHSDSVTCCFSELPGQAAVAEDLQDLHRKALDGLERDISSG